MRERQQNSTSHPINFLMVLADHIAPATGKTPTVAISKDGGTFAAPAGAVSEIGNGWYSLAGNATDRNTLGSFLLNATASGCDPCDRDYTIVGYDPFSAETLGLTILAELAPMIQPNGSGGYRYSANALANGPTGSGGSGSVVVTQDTGGVDNLAYRAFSGAGIGGATVRAYLASEWASNPLTAAVRGEVQTVVTGRWAGVMMLDPSSYIMTFQQPGASGVDTRAVTVS